MEFYGIVGGAGAFVLIVIIIVVCCCRCRRRRRQFEGDTEHTERKNAYALFFLVTLLVDSVLYGTVSQ